MVGPNEAGKTSLLQAMGYAASGQQLPGAWQARLASAISPGYVEVDYELEPDELSELGLQPGQRAAIRKIVGSTENLWTFRPDLAGNAALRAQTRQRLEDALPQLAQAATGDDVDFDLGRAQSVLKFLVSNQRLTDEDLSTLRDVAVEVADVAVTDSEFDDLATVLGEAVEREERPPTHEEAREYLEPRLPVPVYFSPEDRDLQDQYNVSELPNPPRALAKIHDKRRRGVSGQLGDWATNVR